MAEDAWTRLATPGEIWPHLAGRAGPRKRRLFVVACCRRIGGSLTAPMRVLMDVAERYADGEASDEDVRAARDLAFPDLDPLFADAERVKEELAARHPRHLVERVVELALEGGEYPSPGHRFDWVTELAAALAPACPAEPLDQVIALSELAAQSISDAVDRAVEASGDGDPWEAARGASAEAAVAAALLAPYDKYHSREAAELAAQADLLRNLFGRPDHPVSALPGWLTPDVLALARGIYAERTFSHMPILADALEDAGCAERGLLGHCRGPATHVRGCWVVDLLLAKE